MFTILDKPVHKFSPLHISGLRLWLDASRITGLADGDPVGQWNDLSGNGNHATQTTAAKKPLYKTGILNGKPVVRFDGTDDLLLANGIATLLTGTDVPNTVLGIIKARVLPSLGANPCFAGLGRSSAGSAEHRWSLLNSGGTYSYRAARVDDSDASDSHTAGTPDTGTHIATARFTGTAVTWIIDGAEAAPEASLNVGQLTVDRFAIGALVQGGLETLFFDGDGPEFCLYNRALSTAELNRLHRYFGAKYNISVSML